MLCLSGSTRNASIPIGQRVILDKITVQSPFKCPKTNARDREMSDKSFYSYGYKERCERSL